MKFRKFKKTRFRKRRGHKKKKFVTLKKVSNKVVRIQRLMKSDLKFADQGFNAKSQNSAAAAQLLSIWGTAANITGANQFLDLMGAFGTNIVNGTGFNNITGKGCNIIGCKIEMEFSMNPLAALTTPPFASSDMCSWRLLLLRARNPDAFIESCAVATYAAGYPLPLWLQSMVPGYGKVVRDDYFYLGDVKQDAVPTSVNTGASTISYPATQAVTGLPSVRHFKFWVPIKRDFLIPQIANATGFASSDAKASTAGLAADQGRKKGDPFLIFGPQQNTTNALYDGYQNVNYYVRWYYRDI